MNLQNLIIGALKGQNNDERRRAEGLLIQMRQRNTQGFFFQCSQLISNQQNDQFIRQSSGTVLGNSAITKHSGTGKYLWDLLSNEVKAKIKDNLLNTLVSKDLVAMKAGASAISQISAIEIPRGQWLDLVDSLGQNSMNQDFNFKNASIVTIGLMCQQFNKMGVKVNQHTGQQFIGSIIIGSRDSNSNIVATSIAALRNSLIFLDQIMHSKQVRDETFKIISLHIADQRYLRSCYQALFEFIKVCYSYLGEYLEFLLNLTITHMNSRNQNTILALQLWDAIGQEYLSLLESQKGRIKDQQGVNNYLQAYSQKILPQIMKCMLILSENDLQYPQMRQSTLKTLGTFVQACNQSVVDKITQGINYTINSSNPGQRQASTLLFASLCDYHDKSYVQNCFKNGFDHLFKLFNDSEPIVIKNTLNGFMRLFQVFPDIPRNNKKINEIVDLMMSFAQSPDEDVCINSLTALVYLTEKLKKDEPNPINSDPSVLLTKIVKFFDANQMKFHQKMKQANEKIVIIIMNIIVGMDNRETVVQLLEFMLSKYENLLKLRIKFNDYLQVVEQLICIIHTSTLTLRFSVPNPLLLNKICELIHLHVKQIGVDAQSLSLISAATISFTKSFEERLDQFWPYIMVGLQKTNESKIFKTVLTCIGDFARSFETNFAEKGTEVLRKLIKYIKEPIQREQKINMLACLGDLIIGLKSHAEIFLDDLINIMDLFFGATYQLMNNPSQQQYVEQLKQALLDVYACLIFAMNNTKKSNEKLFRHYKSLAYFIVRTCDKSVNPTLQYLKNCLYLIYDAASFYYNNEAYRREVNEIIESNEIGNLREIVKSFKHKPQMNQLLIYMTQRAGIR